MAAIEKLGPYRVVDLSKSIYPDKEVRRCEVIRYYQEWTKDYHSDLNIESHLGTHVETPYHYNDAWPDILGLPLTSFIGRAIVLNLDIEPRAPVTASELEAADKGRIRSGDIVILTSPYHCEPFSNDPNDQRPYLCRESGEWLAAKRVKSIGFGDSVAIEHSVEDACAVHEAVMPYGITFLEVMRNLDQLQTDIFLLIFLPMPIAGLDSCCVRAVAVEGIPEFSA
ncbi:MAG: cyclase family protein [bacterium]|jgi:kynurenine formamidase|nr:cyclase family protein [bacterium]